MTPTDSRRDDIMRLVLQVARDAVAQRHLKTLLTAANVTIAGHRQELRTVKAQMTMRWAASRTP
jgi:hypothetical protein